MRRSRIAPAWSIARSASTQRRSACSGSSGSCRSIDADVLWGPHGTLPLAWRHPSVVTVHDFTSITMPGRHRLKTILSFNLFIGRSLEQASRIACVSRAIADETIRGFGVPASKIEIVPNGVDEFFSPDPEIDGRRLPPLHRHARAAQGRRTI